MDAEASPRVLFASLLSPMSARRVAIPVSDNTALAPFLQQVKSRLGLQGINALYACSTGKKVTGLEGLQDGEELRVVEGTEDLAELTGTASVFSKLGGNLWHWLDVNLNLLGLLIISFITLCFFWGVLNSGLKFWCYQNTVNTIVIRRWTLRAMKSPPHNALNGILVFLLLASGAATVWGSPGGLLCRSVGLDFMHWQLSSDPDWLGILLMVLHYVCLLAPCCAWLVLLKLTSTFPVSSSLPPSTVFKLGCAGSFIVACISEHKHMRYSC